MKEMMKTIMEIIKITTEKIKAAQQDMQKKEEKWKSEKLLREKKIEVNKQD